VITTGVVLAGGKGSRMGIPKARMMIAGEPLARQQATLLLAAGCSRVIIVLGFDGDHIAAVLDPLPDGVDVVINRQWSRGQFSSLQAGLACVPTDTNQVLILPVDVIGVAIETIQHLMQNGCRECDAVVPAAGGQSGHPVVISRGLCHDLLAQNPTDSRLDRYLKEKDVRRIDVSDVAVLANVNRPDQIGD